MKIVKIGLITLLALVVAVILAWCVITYLAWPKPELIGLVPGTPLAYIAASDLDGTLLDAQDSEFAERLARSPLWKNRKSYRLWRQIGRQIHAWEEQMNATINPEGIIQLVEKDAILAFYGNQEKLDFLLVSEVSTLTRMNIKSGGTEKTLAEVYKIAKEKYRGAELITLAVPELKLSYGFIGRAGLLSTDISLLRKCVDLHKGIGQGMVATSEFKELAADLPESDISFHVNAAKIRDTDDHTLVSPLAARAKAGPMLRYLAPVTASVNAWAGAAFRRNGDLIFDIRASYSPPAQSGDVPIFHPIGVDDLTNHGLPVPADCLLFALYEMLDLSILLEAVDATIGTDLATARDKLLPAFHSGAAIVALKPNIKELQLLPPVMIFLQVKNIWLVHKTLKDINGSMRVRGRQLEFIETKYANTSIKHVRVPIGMGMSLDAGYAFIGNTLLALATDVSALEAAIDVSISKKPSLDEHYASVLAPIAEGAEGRLFVDIASTAEIIKQAGRLYAWRAKIAGEQEAEQIATMLYQNVFTLEAWRYMGMTFNTEDGRTNVKMVLGGSKGEK